MIRRSLKWAQVAEIEDNNAYANRKKEARKEITRSRSSVIVIGHPSSPVYLLKDALKKDAEVTHVGDKAMKDANDEVYA